MLPDIRPGNTKILYFFNCLLDGMHTNLAPGFRLLQPKRNKSHKQGNSPTKPIDRLQKSLYNSSVLTYFILRVKNGGEDNEVFY